MENGISYRIGQSFPRGCNTCQCTESGTISCTNRPCGCQYNGRMVSVGESVTAADRCTRLTCQQAGGTMVSDNGVNCRCNYNGMQYTRGQTFAKPGDNCGNTCTCNQNLQVDCTSNTCCRNPMTNQPMRVGEQYQPDECNTCTCTQTGMIACDTKKCHCEYNGQRYPINTPNIRHTDGCQTGQCTANAEIVWDQKVCSCNHMGRVVQIGATFDKGDGCNQCQCMQNGQVSCSNNPVPCSCQFNGERLNIG